MGAEVNSGDKIIYELQDKIWSYIPFNFQNKKRKKQFEELTKNLPITTISDFQAYYRTNENEIKEIYKK